MPEILSNVFFSPLYLCGMLFTLGFMLQRLETAQTPERLDGYPKDVVRLVAVMAGLMVAGLILCAWPFFLGKYLGDRFFR